MKIRNGPTQIKKKIKEKLIMFSEKIIEQRVWE